ncbi:MAG TPA: 3-hydroxyacyl-CoA dehydrogenase [Ottowia sp.]|uniref:3-hydroxyacyl-CoA dehydrogenase n=1 Tax=Ottowia sp. TaxID=1898956 RepID=UPI0011D67F4F|nr:3-hydroxyacyl-CoA dehydrogenase [Ottowia sp.]TXI18925.1 MAG: 3-hydroxyacyl-CoA dehydrogenase [Ottowia sp.]HNE59910.1 3-hydroxyacyl-CoA dehydrogenase [Ottowia sp.]HNI84658.1 3-hydroxyacyl-CoA dehydrogenase [Ottowia sp.]HNJ45322.1 3-hydroxyacyl-CoA dehydrogenase [Ottowia sp.]HNK52295.1 3-hydroxyacyl-CoA dehydrogenase [Ottowia sp.]
MNTPVFSRVGIVGTGAMGRGIAQIAAQAGSTVRLYDTQPDAVAKAREALSAQWDKLVHKGRLTREQADSHVSRVPPAATLADLADCDLVIEAIVERLDVKKTLFAELEGIVRPDAILATNTSSLSVTAIAAGLKHPGRLAGYHFFNPVPLMKVVEVIAGLKTDAATGQRLTDYARQMGHTPVQAADTPGFIVNHAGRGYGTEALRIVGEGVTDFVTVDRILRDQVGFRLGPFELFDLTALDVSHPVMESIYRQYFDEPRYRPSVITAQRLAGGVLGRKSGEGFYRYLGGSAQVAPEPAAPQVAELPPVWVSTRAARRAELYQLLKDLGARIETGQSPSPQALTLVAPLGFDVTTVAVVERLDPARTVGIDLLIEDAATRRRVLATNPATRSDMRDAAHALFARDGKPVSVIHDSGGFVTQRVVAHIVNIAADMCQQRVCSPQDLETAVTLGLGYPLGPLAMGDRWGPANMLEVLFNLQTVYGDPRYRPSPWLRRRGAIGLSLLHEEA